MESASETNSNADVEKKSNLEKDVPSSSDVISSEPQEKLETSLSPSSNNSTAPKSPRSDAALPKEDVAKFKIIFNKQKYDVSFSLSDTIGRLKEHLETIIDVPAGMQKVMVKGLAKDERTLKEVGVTEGAKVMVVGSKPTDVLAVAVPSLSEAGKSETSEAVSSKEPLSQQKQHRKVLDKGVPDDAMPGFKGVKEPLPPQPLSGMVNKSGNKVRLTFKMEADQIWIGTKERTDKVPMNSIKNVVSEPIHDHEEYHMMALQLGPTEASRYWIYWVPSQYVDAIKDAVLGKWQFF